jgi:hypothetical protein
LFNRLNDEIKIFENFLKNNDGERARNRFKVIVGLSFDICGLNLGIIKIFSNVLVNNDSKKFYFY